MCMGIHIYIYGNVLVGTDLAPTVAVMKQSDQKQLTREQDSSDWYKSSQREKLGADLKQKLEARKPQNTVGWLTLWLITS